MRHQILTLAVVAILLCSCTATQRIGAATGKAVDKVLLAAPGVIVDGLIDGALHSDETSDETLGREDRKRQTEQKQQEWKKFWKENPTVNPKMTEAFAND